MTEEEFKAHQRRIAWLDRATSVAAGIIAAVVILFVIAALAL